MSAIEEAGIAHAILTKAATGRSPEDEARRRHEVGDEALPALEHLEHRGPAGADKHTGDGAGMLVQMPDRFLRSVVDFELPELGRYGVAMCFLPRDAARREMLEALMERNV